MDKARILTALAEHLDAELEGLAAAAAAAREGATHEEAKPENEYDTRALEQSYLAGAQAARVEVLAAACEAVKGRVPKTFDGDSPAAVGAAIVVEDEEGEVRRYYLCDVGGGARLEVDGQRWWVLTPSSPLGKRLLGTREGDAVQHLARGRSVELEVVEIF
ncbi:MAG: GreA/GreB family elongation factor [Myxococcota bacterium]